MSVRTKGMIFSIKSSSGVLEAINYRKKRLSVEGLFHKKTYNLFKVLMTEVLLKRDSKDSPCYIGREIKELVNAQHERQESKKTFSRPMSLTINDPISRGRFTLQILNVGYNLGSTTAKFKIVSDSLHQSQLTLNSLKHPIIIGEGKDLMISERIRVENSWSNSDIQSYKSKELLRIVKILTNPYKEGSAVRFNIKNYAIKMVAIGGIRIYQIAKIDENQKVTQISPIEKFKYNTNINGIIGLISYDVLNDHIF